MKNHVIHPKSHPSDTQQNSIRKGRKTHQLDRDSTIIKFRLRNYGTETHEDDNIRIEALDPSAPQKVQRIKNYFTIPHRQNSTT